MELITKEIAKKLPGIGETESQADPICQVKLFNPCGAGTWWIVEKEKNGDLLYGVAEIFEREIGYFSLSELESIKLPFGLLIERDLYFTPTPMSEVMKGGGY